MSKKIGFILIKLFFFLRNRLIFSKVHVLFLFFYIAVTTDCLIINDNPEQPFPINNINFHHVNLSHKFLPALKHNNKFRNLLS